MTTYLTFLESQKVFNLTQVGIGYQSSVVEVAFAFLGLFGQDVAVIGVFTLNLACAGESEALFGGTVGFHFWHCCCFGFSSFTLPRPPGRFCVDRGPTVSKYFVFSWGALVLFSGGFCFGGFGSRCFFVVFGFFCG